MSWFEGETAVTAVRQLPDVTENQSALFAGDTGDLPLETRRALVQLLSGPSLDGHKHPKLWSVLLRDEPTLRKRLCELFLDLVVDLDQQVAFVRQFQSEDADIPKLLRKSQLTFVESALLLFLRQRLAQADANAERAVVSRPEIIEHLAMYERSSNTDRFGFAKRVRAAIEKFKKYNIIQKIRASEDRFEVSPTLKLLFSAEQISALTRVYESLASSAQFLTAMQDPPSEGEE